MSIMFSVAADRTLPSSSVASHPLCIMDTRTVIMNSTVHMCMSEETVHMTMVSCLNCGTPMQIPPHHRRVRCGVCQALNEFTQPGLNAQPGHAAMGAFNAQPGHAAMGAFKAQPGQAAMGAFNAQSGHAAMGAFNAQQCPPPMGAFNAQPGQGAMGAFNAQPGHAAMGAFHAQPCHPPSPLGRKKAVVCGISYLGSHYELKGGIQDAKEMRSFLTDCGFPEYSIMMLTEKETDPYKVPTRENLRRALHWLVQGCQAGDSLVFQYSGHGARLPNHIEGKDHEYETLCPLDFETHGMITGEELNKIIVNPIPPGVKLHAIIDASNNGNILDLPYSCKRKSAGEYVWVDRRSRPDVWKGTSGGDAISFGVRVDDQTSGDNSALSRKSTCGLPRSFSEGYKPGRKCSYYRVMLNIRYPEPVNRFRDLVTWTAAFILTSGSQVALLSACGPFDISEKQFSL